MPKYIEIKLPKCVAYVTREEIAYMLQNIDDVELFKRAIQRGKAIQRSQTLKERINAKKRQEQERQERIFLKEIELKNPIPPLD